MGLAASPLRRARLAGALALALALGCAADPWELASLQARHPGLRELDARRLFDAELYPLPARASIAFFLCRWPDAAPIPVSLPPNAEDAERRVLERALRAWEGAGLGVRFSSGAPPGSGIEIRFAGDRGPEFATPHAATTIADCRVDPNALDAPFAQRLNAQLAFASIQLRRTERDQLGRAVELSPEQLQASALHEIGHALGFQGHTRRGAGVMRRSVDHVRRVGRNVARGAAFRDDAVRALYAVPSGTVVARAPVSAARTRTLDRMLALADERGLEGPLVRVGGGEARLAWVDPEGRPYALILPRSDLLLRSPEGLEVLPMRRAARLLAGQEIVD